MGNLISSLLLPVFVLMMLGAIAGVNPEVILKPIFALVGVLLKALIETLGLIIRLTFEAIVLAILAARKDPRFKDFVAKSKSPKVNVKVGEDQD
jgi:hypothetical protein